MTSGLSEKDLYYNYLDKFYTKGDAVDVYIQDQTTRPLDIPFLMSTGVSTTLASEANSEDTTITLTSITGFTDGVRIGIFDASNDKFYFGKQIGAPSGSTIALDSPIDVGFTSGTPVAVFTDNMSIDGSSTTKVFYAGSATSGTLYIDITRIMGYIQSTTAMDDGTFGDLTELTNGVVLRKNGDIIENIWNVKTNGDIALHSYDFSYTTKPPAGTSFGARFRNSYSGQDKHGVAIRLNPGDTLEILIQDDLSNLEVFKIIAQGHIVEDD